MKEVINIDAYDFSCNCPTCGKRITCKENETFYCERCGEHLHHRAYTKEEIKQAIFEREMDTYED